MSHRFQGAKDGNNFARNVRVYHKNKRALIIKPVLNLQDISEVEEMFRLVLSLSGFIYGLTTRIIQNWQLSEIPLVKHTK